MLEALHFALRNLSATWKVAIFIDGLDEYEGDHAARSNLIEFITALSQSPDVKFCVTSRSWLHDITHQDIKDSVNQELLTTDRFVQLQRQDDVACSQIAL